MTQNNRNVSGQQVQGTDENKTYVVDVNHYVAALGAIDSIESCAVYDLTLGGQAVTGALTGSASHADGVVQSQLLNGSSLAADHYYQLNITINFPSSQRRSVFIRIKAEL